MLDDLRVTSGSPLGSRSTAFVGQVWTRIEPINVCLSPRRATRADEEGEMIIGLAYLLALLSVPVAGGRLGALADLPLRRPGIAVAAIVLQIGVISVLPG